VKPYLQPVFTFAHGAFYFAQGVGVGLLMYLALIYLTGGP
jgi:hypothetical protein